MLSLGASLGISHTFKTAQQGCNLLHCMLVEIAPSIAVAAFFFSMFSSNIHISWAVNGVAIGRKRFFCSLLHTSSFLSSEIPKDLSCLSFLKGTKVLFIPKGFSRVGLKTKSNWLWQLSRSQGCIPAEICASCPVSYSVAAKYLPKGISYIEQSIDAENGPSQYLGYWLNHVGYIFKGNSVFL